MEASPMNPITTGEHVTWDQGRSSGAVVGWSSNGISRCLEICVSLGMPNVFIQEILVDRARPVKSRPQLVCLMGERLA